MEQTKVMQSVSSELSLASSRVMRMQSPQLRAASALLSPLEFHGTAHSVVGAAPRAFYAGAGRMQKMKSGIRSCCLARLSLGNFYLHPALVACVTRSL